MLSKALDANSTGPCSEASSIDGAHFSDPTRWRSTVAAIAAAASNDDGGRKQALKLREGLSLPRQTTLADAKDVLQSGSAWHFMQARAQQQNIPLHQPVTVALLHAGDTQRSNPGFRLRGAEFCCEAFPPDADADVGADFHAGFATQQPGCNAVAGLSACATKYSTADDFRQVQIPRTCHVTF